MYASSLPSGEIRGDPYAPGCATTGVTLPEASSQEIGYVASWGLPLRYTNVPLFEKANCPPRVTSELSEARSLRRGVGVPSSAKLRGSKATPYRVPSRR